MDSQVFTCESCSNEYDTEDRTPRFIPGCGHTLCQRCVKTCLDRMDGSLEFQCPFDEGRFPLNSRDISAFPKNFTLIKMIEGNKSKKLCPIHNKETDLVCIDHNCFICGDCALFGGHKGHNIKRAAELENQMKNKSDELGDLLSRIDKSKDKFFQQGDTILDNKRQILINSIQTRIENIIETLMMRKEQITQDINEYFDNISKDMKNREGVIREIDSMMAKVLAWRNQVGEKLAEAKAAQESGNPIGLLEGNVSIMTPIVEEWLQETQNTFDFSRLEEKIEHTKVVFDEEGIQGVRNFCTFQTGEKEEEENIVLTKKQTFSEPKQRDSVELNVVQPESEAPYTSFENLMEVSNEEKIVEEENRLDDVLKTFDFDVLWRTNNKGKTLCLKDNDKKTASKPFWQKMYNSVVRKKDMLYGFQYLKDLRVSCKDFTDNGIGNLAQTLGGLICLEKLHLDFKENRYLTNGAVFYLGENIVFLSSLKEISINFSACPRINSKGLYNISQGLSKLMNLTSLTLTFDGCSSIDNQGIFYMVNYLGGLQRMINLDLRFNGCYLITDDALMKIGNLISEYIELQKLSLYFAECTRITNNSVIHLNQAMTKLKNLTWFVINLKEALDLTDNGLSQLSQAFAKLNNLVHLDVDFSKCYKLTNHGLSELGNSLMRITTLRKLICHFALCENINDHGLTKFSQGISKLRNLSRLTLDFNNYEIKSNKITQAGFIELSNALTKLLSLNHLELGFEGFTTIGDLALIPLGKGIAQLATLKELVLDFMGCKTISDNGIAKLGEAIAKLINLNLLWLIFKGCDYITAAGKEELMTSTSYLKNLKSPLVIEY